MPSSIRPGEVLADRYRLIDLLTESSSGRFWRAHDKVLERYVTLHVMAEDDPHAGPLLEAARRSATVHDRRLLRVLDADRADGLVYVVNEWGSGDSLDIMLAAEGPLDARRAAWLVSEVASSIAAGHEAGVCHGRLVPENVLVDHAGAVRLIGFAVDAAMFDITARPSTDVADLGGLLYAALTGKWPGPSRSQVPPAPVVQGRVLRPRQVRAGIPRPLDVLCDEVVNPYAGHDGSRLRETYDLASAQGIADYLATFVGDPTGLAEAEAALGHRDTTETISLPAIKDPPPRAPEPEPAPEPDPEPAPVSTELPTEAGLPIFDDENDDVSWVMARSDPAPPPPPFEDPPERPLFAPEPAEGPARRPRRPLPAAASAGSAAYWPWDTGSGQPTGTGTGLTPAVEEPGDDEVPGRSWLRLAAAIAAGLLLLLAIVVAYNLGQGRSPLAVPVGGGDGDPTATSQPATQPAAPISGITARDFDPQGSPPFDEHPELTGLAVDGKPGTAWSTMTYDQNFGPAGLKTGVGLVLDLGKAHDVSAVDLTFLGGPTGYSLYVTDQPPTAVKGLTPVATGTSADDGHARSDLDSPVSGRFVTVWLTSIPAVDGGFRGQVAEVTVRG
ncbi:MULTISPECIES: protein kinase family protein [unclassified Nocardioides]|uniref:protein kinase family protein n=1 Tax=Nocardioides sp. URHA0032 TaxID=1380388 RepID=UPI0004917FA2|nr:protein kinase family protein [Nocardioides sp. URHA0032]